MGTGMLGGLIGVIAGSTALHTTGFYVVSASIVSVLAFIGFICGFFYKPAKVVTKKLNC